MPMEDIAADLRVVATARVYFAHQSVGREILDGVATLAAQAGVPLRIEALGAAPPGPGPGLFHAPVGANGEPLAKIGDFERRVGEAQAVGPYDVALLKFCYVDLDEDVAIDPEALHAGYAAMRARLARTGPDTTVVPATVPLMSDPPGWKTAVKRLIGRATWRDEANRRRSVYNTLLREVVGDAPLFDIARLEATHADGSWSHFTLGDQPVETMAVEYTWDGGHLNEAGRLHVAAGFIRALAEALRSRPSGG